MTIHTRDTSIVTLRRGMLSFLFQTNAADEAMYHGVHTIAHATHTSDADYFILHRLHHLAEHQCTDARNIADDILADPVRIIHHCSRTCRREDLSVQCLPETNGELEPARHQCTLLGMTLHCFGEGCTRCVILLASPLFNCRPFSVSNTAIVFVTKTFAFASRSRFSLY